VALIRAVTSTPVILHNDGPSDTSQYPETIRNDIISAPVALKPANVH
jgi:hypothetical protein